MDTTVKATAVSGHQREYLFDNYKVLLILLVVIGHFIEHKLEDGRYRSSMMWYCRLFAIMMCQHLDAWTLPKTSRLKDLFDQAA